MLLLLLLLLLLYYIIIKWHRLTGLLLQVNLAVGAGSHLGIKVRGGREFGLGIFVTGVDRGSAAELGGLKVSVVPSLQELICAVWTI